MRDLAIIILFAAMLPAGVRATNVGAMIWAWVALGAPGEYSFGIAQGVPFNKVVVGITLLSLVVGKTRNRFFIDANFVVLTLFLLACLISFAAGLSELGRTYDLADRMTKIYVLCVIMMACLQTRLHLHGMVLAICLGMGIHGTSEGLKYIATGGGHILVGRVAFGDNNNFGLAILMVLPFLLYLYRYSTNRLLRYGLLFATAINFVAVIATASRGALLGLVAIVLGMAMRSKRKGQAIVMIAVGAGLLVAFAPEKWTKRMDTIETAEKDGSFMSRVVSWKLNTVVALERPLTGVGFSGLEDRKVFEMFRLRINTTLPVFEVEVPNTPYAAHSIYFQALGDNGFPGFLLFLALIFIAFNNLRAIRRMTRGHDHLAWAYDLANTLWIVVIAYVVAGAALSMAYFEMYYMVLTLISILRQQVSQDATVMAGAQRTRPTAQRVAVPALSRTVRL